MATTAKTVRRKGFWKCPRQSKGERCGHSNPNRKRNCESCGKARPARRRPAHMAALDLSYEEYIELNGGEHCGICGRERSPHKKLDRDHDHHTKQPRGLLCNRCNRALPSWMNEAWLQAALTYLARAKSRESV